MTKKSTSIPGPPGQRASERIKGNPAFLEKEIIAKVKAKAPQGDSPSPASSNSTDGRDVDVTATVKPYVAATVKPTNPTPLDYPIFHYDPDPLPASASDAMRAEHKSSLNDFGTQTLEDYKDLGLKGEEL